MILAQVETALKVVDQAASATDRWLFLAALVVLMSGGALCIRWLVNSIQNKDKEHESNMSAQRAAHEKERAEWRVIMQDSKAEFFTALNAQQASFRAELSTERHQCAEERTLDREARHLMANALQSISNVLMKYNIEIPHTAADAVTRPKGPVTKTEP